MTTKLKLMRTINFCVHAIVWGAICVKIMFLALAIYNFTVHLDISLLFIYI